MNCTRISSKVYSGRQHCGPTLSESCHVNATSSAGHTSSEPGASTLTRQKPLFAVFHQFSTQEGDKVCSIINGATRSITLAQYPHRLIPTRRMRQICHNSGKVFTPPPPCEIKLTMACIRTTELPAMAHQSTADTPDKGVCVW